MGVNAGLAALGLGAGPGLLVGAELYFCGALTFGVCTVLVLVWGHWCSVGNRWLGCS
jgi:hypothetical protein